jgi:1,5-anhydro-D-fructose reductase (1,5-anhydro-D-mannitol-forming)
MSAEAGKHVLVEKPMAVNGDDAVEMVRTCRRQKVKLGVGFQLRHHPGFIKARQLVQEGTLGLITMAQAQFFFPTPRAVTTRVERNDLTQWWEEQEKIGGSYVLMGMGVHAIDILQFLLDQPITEVAAITDGESGKAHIDDTAALALRFRGGMLGTVCCGRFAPDSRNDAVIYGSNGRILLEDALRERCGGTLAVASESVNLSESFEPNLLTLYKRQIEAFSRAVQEDTEFNASGEDGLSVVQVTSAAINSAATGRTVKVEPIQVED